MEEVLNIVVDLLSSALALCMICLVKAAYDYLKTKITEAQTNKLDKFIYELTAAADQTLKEEDPNGSIRYEYVLDNLIEAGYEITDAVIAKIEANVFNLPHDIKGVETK